MTPKDQRHGQSGLRMTKRFEAHFLMSSFISLVKIAGYWTRRLTYYEVSWHPEDPAVDRFLIF